MKLTERQKKRVAALWRTAITRLMQQWEAIENIEEIIGESLDLDVVDLIGDRSTDFGEPGEASALSRKDCLKDIQTSLKYKREDPRKPPDFVKLAAQDKKRKPKVKKK